MSTIIHYRVLYVKLESNSFLDLPNILTVLLHLFVRRPRLVWSIRAAGMEMQHYDWLSRSIPFQRG
jgi:hypothetical protein